MIEKMEEHFRLHFSPYVNMAAGDR